MFKKNRKNLVGLDVGSSSVKAVELQGKSGNLNLVSLGVENLHADAIVDGQIMELNDVSAAISNIFTANNIATERVAAGVGGSNVIVKNIFVPQMSEAELEESIEWHAEEHIPFEITDVALDYQVVGSSPESLQVLMAACKRDRVANLKQAIQLAGKQPMVIDVDAFAIQNCYEVNYEPQAGDIVALLNIGASTMNINIIQGTHSVFTRDVSVGGNQYTTVLQKEFGLTFEQAEEAKRTWILPEQMPNHDLALVLEPVTEMLTLEIGKTFDFYRATADENTNATVGKILVSGGGSKVRGLAESLAARFEIPVEMFNPFRKIKVDAHRFDPDLVRDFVPEMAVAVGLALRGVEAR
jgi:type IV pilus assembly protein PilM